MEYNFEDFKQRALDTSLSKWEKIGFPDSYRSNTESLIFEDIYEKLNLEQSKSILDIGCGCSELVDILIDYSIKNNKILYLVDSDEMLSNVIVPDNTSNVFKIGGRFPDVNVIEKINAIKFDAVLVYSVIQYVFLEQSIFSFIHHCVDLLAAKGRILIGDIPNYQTRERFLSSGDGVDFLNNLSEYFPDTNKLKFDHQNNERIDDFIIASILLRYRNFGCETYLLPQKDGLPFANRREDILIYKR